MAHPLKLHATPGNWRLFMARKEDPSFKPFAEKIFSRDNFTCQFCGFQAMEFQEVINLDQNYHNNKTSNLVTTCVFCSQCFFVESVGIGDYGGGTLIYLPDMAQTELNSFCHVLFCAISNNTGYKDTAQDIYRSFRYRTAVVEEKLGEGTSNPAMLGQSLIDLQLQDKSVMDEVFDSLRLLPSLSKFRPQIEHWATSAVTEMNEAS